MIDGRPFSPRKFDQFELIRDSVEALILLKNKGYLNIVVTNQPDVSRGLLKIEELNKMSDFMMENLELDDIYSCPHDDSDGCECRKPKNGMLLKAAQKWDIELGLSYMVGDNWKDIEAGKLAGCRTILIDAPYNKGVSCDRRVSGIKGAAELIVNEGSQR